MVAFDLKVLLSRHPVAEVTSRKEVYKYFALQEYSGSVAQDNFSRRFRDWVQIRIMVRIRFSVRIRTCYG